MRNNNQEERITFRNLYGIENPRDPKFEQLDPIFEQNLQKFSSNAQSRRGAFHYHDESEILNLDEMDLGSKEACFQSGLIRALPGREKKLNLMPGERNKLKK